MIFFRKLLIITTGLGVVTASVAMAESPLAASTDGTEVKDNSTGLIWRRCAEGMTWNGTTCAGTAFSFTHEAAITHAAMQASGESKPWRLPNARELGSIVMRTTSPAIDQSAFPGTPTALFWTATPYPRDPSRAWYVSFDRGTVDHHSRGNVNLIRLVRD